MDIFEQVAEMRAEEARVQIQESFIKRLLAETELSFEKIASLTNVSLSQVHKIKENLLHKIITRSSNPSLPSHLKTRHQKK